MYFLLKIDVYAKLSWCLFQIPVKGRLSPQWKKLEDVWYCNQLGRELKFCSTLLAMTSLRKIEGCSRDSSRFRIEFRNPSLFSSILRLCTRQTLPEEVVNKRPHPVHDDAGRLSVCCCCCCCCCCWQFILSSRNQADSSAQYYDGDFCTRMKKEQQMWNPKGNCPKSSDQYWTSRRSEILVN